MKRTRTPYRHPGTYTRAPRPGRCRGCRKPILSGWYRGDPITLDRASLTPLGELAALLLGLRTYHAVGSNLYRRGAHTIRDEPNPSYGGIHRAHHCGKTPPDGVAVRETPAEPESDTPPF